MSLLWDTNAHTSSFNSYITYLISSEKNILFVCLFCLGNKCLNARGSVHGVFLKGIVYTSFQWIPHISFSPFSALSIFKLLWGPIPSQAISPLCHFLCPSLSVCTLYALSVFQKHIWNLFSVDSFPLLFSSVYLFLFV